MKLYTVNQSIAPLFPLNDQAAIYSPSYFAKVTNVTRQNTGHKKAYYTKTGLCIHHGVNYKKCLRSLMAHYIETFKDKGNLLYLYGVCFASVSLQRVKYQS